MPFAFRAQPAPATPRLAFRAPQEPIKWTPDKLVEEFGKLKSVDVVVLIREVYLIAFTKYMPKTVAELGREGAVFDFLENHKKFQKTAMAADRNMWLAYLALEKDAALALVQLANRALDNYLRTRD